MSHLANITAFGLLMVLAIGCSHGVTDVSGTAPYHQFSGKIIASKESGAIWINTSGSYQIRREFIRFDSDGDFPSYSTEYKRLFDFSAGTRFKIESIKHKKVSSEIGGFDGVVVLCTATLQDGRRIQCQMPWELIDPDPRRGTGGRAFDIVEK
ncbi:MAG: hypothetical protein QM813_14165 [Verrucomicrobiota bacterium]